MQYWHFQGVTTKWYFSEFISNNTHTFRELLQNKSKYTFRVHVKHYYHFQGVTPKQYYTLFLTSNNTDIFRELLANNTTHFSRVYIIQYWHFQRITTKQYWLFQSSYQTVFTLSLSYYQLIDTLFLWVQMDTWTDRKFSNRKVPSKCEKS